MTKAFASAIFYTTSKYSNPNYFPSVANYISYCPSILKKILLIFLIYNYVAIGNYATRSHLKCKMHNSYTIK